MNRFVDIKTFFNSPEERTVDCLRSVYNDSTLLYESVKELMLPHLTPNQIRGQRVLLKPNFVKESIKDDDDICLITHPSFILATVKALLECDPQSIVIGDAPIQNCKWNLLLSKDFYREIKDLSVKYGVPIKVVDFRKVVFYVDKNDFGSNGRTDEDYLIFDVGNRSWLEPITTIPNKFRVTNYDPDRMALSHTIGKHKYCIAREIFESDIVIVMPKPKTHRMACLTNSLKVLVGINGDKDYLPHHRIGSQSQGGDCYKDYNLFRSLGERIRDSANRKRGTLLFRPLKKIASIVWAMGQPNDEINSNAGWYGNDTVWRMVMDLNMIAQYGTINGDISDIPQRTIYTLCDGIIGGQGNGPLNPEPLALGLIAFSNDSYLMDEFMGCIFRLNINKVPLLREAAVLNENKDFDLFINGNMSTKDKIVLLSTEVELAPGWVNYDKQ